MQLFPSSLLYPVTIIPINLFIYKTNAPISSVNKYVMNYDVNSYGYVLFNSQISLFIASGGQPDPTPGSPPI